MLKINKFCIWNTYLNQIWQRVGFFKALNHNVSRLLTSDNYCLWIESYYRKKKKKFERNTIIFLNIK